jgi:hypothetical protein
MAVIIDIPGILFTVLSLIVDKQGPWYWILFAYVGPMILVFFTLYDLMAFGPWRRTTRLVIAGALAVGGARFGYYANMIYMIQTIFGPTGEASLWFALFTNVLGMGLILFIVSSVLRGFLMAKAAGQSLNEMIAGGKTLDHVGTTTTELANKKMNK